MTESCIFGLWCPNGQRGQFVRGDDRCKRCSVVAWKHSSKAPKGAAVTSRRMRRAL